MTAKKDAADMKEKLKQESRMTKIESSLKNIQHDISEIKALFQNVDHRIDQVNTRVDDLDKTKHMLQGMGIVLGSAVFILFLEAFVLGK